MQKIDHLHKRCSDLLAEMKRHERESIKNKKRGDQLQKEKDASRNELSKQITLKEKLEKLCREIQRENNKLKVIRRPPPAGCGTWARPVLTSIPEREQDLDRQPGQKPELVGRKVLGSPAETRRLPRREG